MKDKYLHIRIDTDTKEKLKELASKEGRTPSSYIIHMINTEHEKSRR